jgi:hypothetical protein
LNSCNTSILPAADGHARPDRRETFADAVGRLNHCVVQARNRLELENIRFEHRSGYFGRDSLYRWFFHFEQRKARGLEIVVTSADLICLEPSSETQGEVEARWTAETFQPGQPPRFKRDSRIKLALAQVLSGDLTALVHNLIRQAETALPPAASLFGT